MLNWIHSWLAHEDAMESVDLLFVLAGLQGRKEYGLKLFQEGSARQLLFSVGRFEIRKFPKLNIPGSPDLLALAKDIPPARRHFFVLFCRDQFNVKRIPVRRLGTLNEIDALADWLLLHPEVSSLLIVSSGSHLRRLRLCGRALLSDKLVIRLRRIPPNYAIGNEDGLRKAVQTLRETLLELLKILCYALILPVWKVVRRRRSVTLVSLNQ